MWGTEEREVLHGPRVLTSATGVCIDWDGEGSEKRGHPCKDGRWSTHHDFGSSHCLDAKAIVKGFLHMFQSMRPEDRENGRGNSKISGAAKIAGQLKKMKQEKTQGWATAGTSGSWGRGQFK